MPNLKEAPDWIAPCPACNDDDNEEGAVYDHGPDGVRLQCDCGCCGPWGLTLDEARTEWNRLLGDQYQQGELDGLRKAARLVCEHCADDVPRRCMPSGIICHGKVGDQAFPWCSAGSIHAEIARLEKERT